MTEDTQTGKMSAQSQIVNAADKCYRKGGMNLQHDFDKNYKYGNLVHPRGGSKKNGKHFRQSQFSNKEPSFSGSIKKKSSYKGKYPGKDGNDETDPSNIQSLLNFQYTPARSLFSSSQSTGSRRKRTTTFNKESFLQANCHFVVDASKKYGVNTIDPDVLVEWEDIQLVYLPTHDSQTCPICLFPPNAAKITKCGHVYCWSCMLHYLKLSEKSWQKCPICHEAVHEKDLKRVICCTRKKFSRLDMITMKLMRRSKDSLFALPVTEWKEDMKASFPIWEDIKSFHYGYKLALTSQESVLDNILLKEKSELIAQLNEALTDKTGEECFIQAAINNVQEKIDSIKKSLSRFHNNDVDETVVNLPVERDDDDDDLSSLAVMLNEASSNDEEKAFSDNEEEQDVGMVATASVLHRIETENVECLHVSDEIELDASDNYKAEIHSARRPSPRYSESSTGSWESYETNARQDKRSYYFFQADDGQNIFVHSLNARCLIEEYGSLAECPDSITGQIIDFECFTMTKDLRKRFRYLTHLPLSCEFVIVELVLRPPFLSKHTIHNFMPEFKKRKEIRFKKLEEQRKFDRRARAVRNKQEGFRSEDVYEESIHLDLTDVVDFPQNLSPELADSKSTEVETTTAAAYGPSFAQILRMENAPKTTSVWGGPPVKDVKPICQVRRSPDTDGNDSEDDLVAPSFKEMFSAAIFTTDAQVEESRMIAIGRENQKKKSAGGKKKKGKGTLLFTTGAQRKY